MPKMAISQGKEAEESGRVHGLIGEENEVRKGVYEPATRRSG
jgi:hypothetical protein